MCVGSQAKQEIDYSGHSHPQWEAGDSFLAYFIGVNGQEANTRTLCDGLNLQSV